MLPLALQAGVSIDDFWHDNEDYVYMRIKAYYNKVSYEGWVHGLYIYNALRSSMLEALPVGVSKVLSKENRDVKVDYPLEPFDFIEGYGDKEKKKQSTKETNEQKFRRITRSWL